MLDYAALSAVACVVREGSFERAAERLGVTPSAVSQRVRTLEERLGSILIVRGQPCVATGLGRRLCAHIDQVQLLEADLALTTSLFIGLDDVPITLKIAVNSDSIATWFPEAAAHFAKATGYLLEFIIEDEALTADRLRSGEVLGAVSADPGTVQGCKTIELGSLEYRACCSPDFATRYFSNGVTEEALRCAPCLRFERRDGLQARWARETHGIELDAPMHWVPSTSGFLNFALQGMAWGMHPTMLARPWIANGELVEMNSGAPINVKLFWTVTRLHALALKTLTDAVLDVGRSRLQEVG
ncbi:LysR family transcriptional regulator (chromosome initiation inhibitor) [Novosphingobium chloroacetimidivorans]|uniref:LysR family transcriptional regulator (Chromosome initiation inhibitor) n=1 Tax=Novosphingobium chloroacetimidivorans TaxID=1428314 RepID=A0A7W7KE31_9SPHN|nr:LysR family transcriptional regulator ArgP [Novosphingobium chloroacetimidivorans]MBB4861146.1 LysR family transcriptional regulator (chromosome initiation inhibitor) [Novosphingobium chloroacetimidivorans]